MRHDVNEQNDPKRYWTQIPNIVLELNLKPVELVLYVHLKRTTGDDRKCTKSSATLMRETGLGAGTISRAKTELAKSRPELDKKALIQIKEVVNPKGGKPYQEITITDIWPVNMKRFAPSSVEIESTSSVDIAKNQVPMEGDPSSKPTSKPISSVEISNNSNKNYKEKQVQEKQIGEAEPSHPTGIALLRDVQGMYPPKERNSAYLEILGDDPDDELLRECRAEWLDRGYNKMSWKWFTDWYAKGGIQNGNGGRPTAPVEWQIVDGKKIKVLPPGTVLPSGAVMAEDRGEIYYVVACNGDGVSPRFRTAEAFAESRGLTMDQVLKPGQTWPRPKILWS